jgi:hypothetical protein
MRIEDRLAALEARLARVEGRLPPPALPERRSAGTPMRLPTGKMRRILDAVSEEFGVGVEALLAPSRVAHVALARQVAMALALRVHNVSTIEIGRLMQRDHSTVHHARDKVLAMASADPEFGARLDRLAELLRQPEAGRAAA